MTITQKDMTRDHAVLLIPKNDAEPVLILKIAEALRISAIVSRQPHGARLSNEKGLLDKLRALKKTHIVIIEIPGPKQEQELTDAGFTLHIIDHHRYDGLDRARQKTGALLRSSLEQFLDLFHITDQELRAHGFDPRLVRGVGAMDRGFIWALREEGYGPALIQRVSRYVQRLTKEARETHLLTANREEAKKAWRRRTEVGPFLLVSSVHSKVEIRPDVSLFAAACYGKPVPIIVSSRGGKLLYVQDTPLALELFKKFGGFTFGQDRCWGYNNATAKRKITLDDLLFALGLMKKAYLSQNQ
jgi:hypothetical protein